jgi:hypothetical protein
MDATRGNHEKAAGDHSPAASFHGRLRHQPRCGTGGSSLEMWTSTPAIRRAVGVGRVVAADRCTLKHELLWVSVTAASLLAAYVQTVDHAIERGESWRQAQRAVATQLATRLQDGAPASDARHADVDAP